MCCGKGCYGKGGVAGVVFQGLTGCGKAGGVGGGVTGRGGGSASILQHPALVGLEGIIKRKLVHHYKTLKELIESCII